MTAVISAIKGGGLFLGNVLIRRKGPQDAGRQRSIDFFIQFEEDQADLVAVGEESVARRLRKWADS
jgi:hypothetical protein